MRKAGLIFTVMLAVIVAGAYVVRDDLALRLMPRAAERVLGSNLLQQLPDGLHIALCGAGSPMPDPVRSGPCVAVIAGGKLLVIDSGSGAARNLNRMGIPAGNIEAVFLTHFHSDHIDGLGELGMMRWVQAANTAPLPVHGPQGVQQVVAGFNQAYLLDSGYRTAHHGEAVAPPSGAGLAAVSFDAPVDGTPVTVWERDGVRVEAFRVPHHPVDPAVGLRITYAGRSVVVSGDTVRSEAVADAARGVDLLLHEALETTMVGMLSAASKNVGNPVFARITADIPDYHTTPAEAAELAESAGVRMLLYYHIVPALVFPGSEKVFLRGTAERFSGTIVLGRDGTLVSLPAGGKEISVSSLM
jgi:ribonuclease Z